MPRKTRGPEADGNDRRGRFNEAAARCRGKPPAALLAARDSHRASMRPRPDAAENLHPRSRTLPLRLRFNEAAARCRGKPQYGSVIWTFSSQLQ